MTSEWQEAASFFTPEQAAGAQGSAAQDAPVAGTSRVPATDAGADQHPGAEQYPGMGARPRVGAETPAPDAGERPFTVVVGVSPTSGSPYALAWAAAEARSHGGRVIAVQAWKPVVPSASRRPTAAPSAHTDATVRAEAEQSLADAVARVLGDDHGVECRLVRGGRRTVLTEASRDADLLVVDAARVPEFGAESRLSRRLVRLAHCPVVVLPPDVAGAPPSWLQRALTGLGRGVLRAAGTAGRPGGQPTSGLATGGTVEHPAP